MRTSEIYYDLKHNCEALIWYQIKTPGNRSQRTLGLLRVVYRSEKSTSLNVIEPIFSLSPLTAYFFQSLPYWRITLPEVAQSQTTSSYCCGHRTIRRLLPKFFSSPHHPWMCFSLIKRIIGYDRTNQTLNLLTALFYNSPFFAK